MYVPRHYALDESAAWALLQSVGAGHLVVATKEEMRGVFVPVVADPNCRTLRGHVSCGNSWWSAASNGETPGNVTKSKSAKRCVRMAVGEKSSGAQPDFAGGAFGVSSVMVRNT